MRRYNITPRPAWQPRAVAACQVRRLCHGKPGDSAGVQGKMGAGRTALLCCIAVLAGLKLVELLLWPGEEHHVR